MQRFKCMKEETEENTEKIVSVKAKHLVIKEDFEIRKGGSFEDSAIWLTAPPVGYEWTVGIDEMGLNVCFLMKIS